MGMSAAGIPAVANCLFGPSGHACMALSARELQKERHFEHFHRLDLRECQACVLCSCCRPMTLGHGTLRLWSHQTVLVGQDLAEPETLEAEVVPTSNAATRAAMPQTTRSTLAILFGPPGHGTRGTLWLWSHEELAEPEPLEAEAAPGSKAATRAARPPTACSTFEMLSVVDATDCVSDMILFSNLVDPCTSMGNDASAPRCISN